MHFHCSKNIQAISIVSSQNMFTIVSITWFIILLLYFLFLIHSLKYIYGASLVAQRLGIRLPVQGTRVRAPVREDPTCRGAARPVSHNYWACASGACAPQRARPREWKARAPWWGVAPARRKWRKPVHRNEDPAQTTINK